MVRPEEEEEGKKEEEEEEGQAGWFQIKIVPEASDAVGRSRWK